MDVVYHEDAIRDLEGISKYYKAHVDQSKVNEIVARIRHVIVSRARVGFSQAAFYNADDDAYVYEQLAAPGSCFALCAATHGSAAGTGAGDPVPDGGEFFVRYGDCTAGGWGKDVSLRRKCWRRWRGAIGARAWVECRQRVVTDRGQALHFAG